MPFAPRRPCSYPGCKELISSDSWRCIAHTAQYEKERGSAHQRGYSVTWQKARASYLAEHPLCELCLTVGCVTQATEIDHIQPHRGNHTLFWNQRNWQALCKSCHSTKTAKEDGRWAS